MDNSPPERKAPLKGSWEDLLNQADHLAANFNDAAIPLYQRVVDGLYKLPPTARRAADGKLHKLFMRGVLGYQGYLNTRDRFVESLDVLAKLESVVESDDDKKMARLLTAQVNILADRFEDGIAIYRSFADRSGATLADWQPLLWTYIRAGRAAEALHLIPVLMQIAAAEEETRAESGAGNPEDSGSPLAFARAIAAVVQLEAGETAAALASYDELLALGKEYAGNAFTAYSRLAQQGRYEDALRYIEVDRARMVRASFWRGLVLDLMGQPKRAREAYAVAATPQSLEQDSRSISEHILAQYALGDPEAKALESLLSLLRERPATDNWIIFYLIGIGWIVRGDLTAARANLRLAVTQIKWHADGHAIPALYWFMAQRIIPADHHAEFQTYFERPHRPDATATSAAEPAAPSDPAPPDSDTEAA